MRLSVPISASHLACPRFARLFVLALVGALCAVPAYASDPFEMESSSWMSFDRYKEQPSHWIAPDARVQALKQPVIVPPPVLPADLPTITAPTRSIATPSLPGISKDFDAPVKTVEQDGLRIVPTITHMDTQPDFDLEAKWQDAAKAAREHQDKTQALESDDNKVYAVRLSYLPTLITPMKKPVIAPKPELAQTRIPDMAAEQATTPTPSPSTTASVAAEVQTAKSSEATPAAAIKTTVPSVTDKPKMQSPRPEVCAAIDAYKKRQLAAIESDRQTLAALQNAIAELGLGKQLDFMVGSHGKVEVQPAASAMDVAPATTKNP